MGFYDLMILWKHGVLWFHDFMIEITCLAEPLAPHRPPASRRASPCLRSPGATCLHVSRPAGQHHSGYAPDRLVARSTASIVNSRRLVSRKIGCGVPHHGQRTTWPWWTESESRSVSVGVTRHRIRAGSASATTVTVTAAAAATASESAGDCHESRSVDWRHVHPSYMWPDPLHVASCSRSTETWPWQVPVCISDDFTASFQYMIS